MKPDAGHEKLKERAEAIFEKLGFVSDTEVKFEIDGSMEDDFAPDAAGFIKTKELKPTLFLVEAKNRKETPNKNQMDGWAVSLAKIKNSPDSIKVRSSGAGKITTAKVRTAVNLKFIVVIGSKPKAEAKEAFQRRCAKQGFVCWDIRDLKYYERLARAIGPAARYELLKDAGFSETIGTTHEYPALEVRQDAGPKMYLTGLPPALLLRLSYVSRRATRRAGAYQRIINADRVRDIADTIRNRRAMFPNAVIIACDDGIASYEEGILTIKPQYCSAWLIDGQHRVYGFAASKFDNGDLELSHAQYLLPTVVFIGMSQPEQSQTFVNINSHQKKIDPNLLSDLARDGTDLTNELTWPSKIAVRLNDDGPLKGFIRFGELDERAPFNLASFTNYGLLQALLGHRKSGAIRYAGPLKLFDPNRSFTSAPNVATFEVHVAIIRAFFQSVRAAVQKGGGTWDASNPNGLLTNSGVNGLFLVLARILQDHPNDVGALMMPLSTMNVGHARFSDYPGGWKGYRKIANDIIRHLNKSNAKKLRLVSKKRKL